MIRTIKPNLAPNLLRQQPRRLQPSLRGPQKHRKTQQNHRLINICERNLFVPQQVQKAAGVMG